MATNIIQKPNKLAAAYSPMIFVISETSSGIYNGFKFRYIVQVFIDDVEKAKLKLHKNSSNDCVVDVSKIVRTYLETQLTNVGNVVTSYSGSIHQIGVSDTGEQFSRNNSQLCKVTVKAGYEVATSATSAPAETLDADNDTIYAIPATTPYTKTGTNIGGLDASGSNEPLKFFTNNLTAEDNYKFFTNAPTTQFVRGSSISDDNLDVLTVCFKQGNSGASSLLDFGEKIEYMKVEYFDAAGNAITGTSGSVDYYNFANSGAQGGATAAEATSVNSSILYFGCGPRNLEAQSEKTDARPSNHVDWAYYRISGHTANSSAVDTYRCTKQYYFYRYGSGVQTGLDDRHQSCSRYDNVRLAFRNRLGAWDYFNFRGKSIEKLDISRESMAKVSGTWDSTSFNYETWDRGSSTLFTEAKRKLTANTDWLNEEEAIWLEELFTSSNVHIILDRHDDGYTGVTIPVVINDKSYVKKTSVNNKIKIQYTVNLEYANKVRTNS
tara:strand:- start:2936 stop:4417 length:1482 start_codon:yes stop_codon:yes gene_type:complete